MARSVSEECQRALSKPTSTYLDFAGLRFLVSGLNEIQCNTITDRFNDAQCVNASLHPVIELEIDYAQFDTPDISSLTGLNGEYSPILEHGKNEVTVKGYDFLAIISLAPRLTGKAYFRHGKDLDLSALENCMRILTAYAALDVGGLFMHSSCVITPGGALLFLGRSGAGKTTISRMALAGGAGVLSDDANVIMPSGSGSFVVENVPFSGELGQTSSMLEEPQPLAGIFWLEKDQQPEVRATATGLQVARVMSCSSIVNVDAARFEQLATVIASVLEVLPLRSLGFVLDQSFEDICRYAIEGNHALP